MSSAENERHGAGGPVNDLESLLEWFAQRRAPGMMLDRLNEYYHTVHPRSVFFHCLPQGAKLLDFGAGNGSLAIYRRWPGPERPDIAMYAYSLEFEEGFRDYDGYEIGQFEQSPPDFAGVQFDALYASHVIEHLASVSAFAQWVGSRLSDQARVYLEWPSEASLELPTATELREHGVDLMISNFRDDATHKAIPSRNEVREHFEKCGFFVESEGVIRFPWLEERYMAHAEPARSDPTIKLNAYWSKTGWAQYVVLSRGAA